MSALFRVQFGVVQRSRGDNALMRLAYQTCARVKHPSGTFDFRRKRHEHAGTVLMLPADAPEWAQDGAEIWRRSEAVETRKNSQVARTGELTIPRQVPPHLRADFIRAACAPLVEAGMAVQADLHRPGRPGRRRAAARAHHRHHEALRQYRYRVRGQKGVGVERPVRRVRRGQSQVGQARGARHAPGRRRPHERVLPPPRHRLRGRPAATGRPRPDRARHPRMEVRGAPRRAPAGRGCRPRSLPAGPRRRAGRPRRGRPAHGRARRRRPRHPPEGVHP